MISLVKIALSPSNDDRVKGGGGACFNQTVL